MRNADFRRFSCLFAVALLFLPAVLTAQADTGDADFSRYVALGDSLTAGVASAGLVRTVQDTSYPALIFRQVTGTTTGFEQPLISEPGLPPLLELKSLQPLVIAPRAAQPGNPINLQLPRPYDNLGIPGADVAELLTVTSDDGGAFDLVLRNLGFTALEQALALDPTFVSVWIGNNDALAAATSGLVIDGVTLTKAGPFEQAYRQFTGAIAASGAPMALATIPDVTAIPFVTTIPPVVVDPTTGEPVVGPGGQPVPLLGPGGPLTPQDNVLITAGPLLAQGIGIPAQLGGTGQPLPNEVVLDAAETGAIVARTAQFNDVIRAVATETGSALVETASLFDEAATDGIEYGGAEFTTEFLTGGLISYDAVHPTPFAYAIVANEFIRSINETFDADIPLVDLFPFIAAGSPSPAGISVVEASSAIFTSEADDQLRFVLGVPSAEELRRIRDDRPEDPGSPGDGKPTDRPTVSIAVPSEAGAEPASPDPTHATPRQRELE